MRCKFFANERQKLHDDIYRIDASVKNLNEGSLIYVLLYVSDRFHGSKNKQILLHAICNIQSIKRFEILFVDQCVFRSITTFAFFPYMSAKALSAVQPFILSTLISTQLLDFSKDSIGDISYYMQPGA